MRSPVKWEYIVMNPMGAIMYIIVAKEQKKPTNQHMQTHFFLNIPEIMQYIPPKNLEKSVQTAHPTLRAIYMAGLLVYKSFLHAMAPGTIGFFSFNEVKRCKVGPKTSYNPLPLPIYFRPFIRAPISPHLERSAWGPRG